jgi:hypothetical protein
MEFNTPDAGTRFVAAVFRVTGTSGTSHDDVNLDATANGSDGQVYQPVFSTLAGYTNFNSGDFTVTPNVSETGLGRLPGAGRREGRLGPVGAVRLRPGRHLDGGS